jgi:uncharacterized SAM-binding protein YcdF (DUF218 family)
VARERGVGEAQLALEREARNTWQNVELGLPLVGDADVVLVASDPLHARRGVRYLCRQRPERCAHAFPVSRYAPIERAWWKLPAALYELRQWLREPARGAAAGSGGR